MARAYPQSQPSDYQRDGGDWQSLRQELVTLLDKVDGEVSRSRRGYGERGGRADRRNAQKATLRRAA